MGFVLFTARKMSLQSKINDYNLKLMHIENRRVKLTQKADSFTKSQNMVDAIQAKRAASLKGEKTINKATKFIGQQLQAFSEKCSQSNVLGNMVSMVMALGAGMNAGSDVGSDCLDVKETVNSIGDTVIDAVQLAAKDKMEASIAIEQAKLDTEKQRLETLRNAASVELNTVTQQENAALGIK